MRSRGTRTRNTLAAAAVAALLGVAGAGCGGADDGAEPAGPGGTRQGPEGSAPPRQDDGEASAEVAETVAQSLPSPWGLAVPADGGLLVGSRDEATVSHIDPASGEVTELATVPGVVTGAEGGLLGLALDDGLLYVYCTTEEDNRVLRMAYDAQNPALGEPEEVFTGIPSSRSRHNGGRIAFGPDGMLYIATGDTGDEPGLAQDADSLAGKILRVTPDGEVPGDNPAAGSPVYSLGHRNVQGLAWDDQDRLWASEFGDRAWDELNLIEPGGNYGWPETEGSGGAEQGFIDPVLQWPTDEASPSGLAWNSGALWMASLRGERLWRIGIGEDGSAGEPRAFLEGEYGRLRTVQAVGEGELLLVTNETDGRGSPQPEDDRILRLRVN
ncbi:PQQ-dependent sugar dehydrogenase [Streptomyces aidingensis]|uniref:Glucose/arabinose dehydrogenase, beta-propeller fold n=1 Tax=Streptomyces aidingensis TaxID=910347 RepID=A0A1I1NVS3_9ACTN|nr:PQQ-dependent sugar dehydrogenase [Streptomyces aidingensis]SFC98833.1 Glucose/arabinose dehydrogenase, beta-propeller fold [Streptomyces aidingensis]